MNILKDYSDKAFISSILCDLSYNFYSTIYNISLLPTILGSSVLTILNSSVIDDDIMKKINIIINGSNALILALINSYKINDRVNNFKNNQIKFNKLHHIIESVIIKNGTTDEAIDKGIIESLINDYDKLWEEINYQFPQHIRKKVIKKYGGQRKLPNSLDIDYTNSIKADFVNTIQAV